MRSAADTFTGVAVLAALGLAESAKFPPSKNTNAKDRLENFIKLRAENASWKYEQRLRVSSCQKIDGLHDSSRHSQDSRVFTHWPSAGFAGVGLASARSLMAWIRSPPVSFWKRK